jgi:alanine racemase
MSRAWTEIYLRRLVSNLHAVKAKAGCRRVIVVNADVYGDGLGYGLFEIYMPELSRYLVSLENAATNNDASSI